jgi:hypothetical protein
MEQLPAPEMLKSRFATPDVSTLTALISPPVEIATETICGVDVFPTMVTPENVVTAALRLVMEENANRSAMVTPGRTRRRSWKRLSLSDRAEVLSKAKAKLLDANISGLLDISGCLRGSRQAKNLDGQRGCKNSPRNERWSNVFVRTLTLKRP